MRIEHSTTDLVRTAKHVWIKSALSDLKLRRGEISQQNESGGQTGKCELLSHAAQITNRRDQGVTGFRCNVGGKAEMPLMIKRHRLDRSERRPLIGSVDSDTLMTLRLAVIEFLCSFRAAHVAIARGVYAVTCPAGTSLAGAIPARSILICLPQSLLHCEKIRDGLAPASQ